MTATTTGHVPSVSELQAALLAARNGHFATPDATVPVSAAPADEATPPATPFVASPVPPSHLQAPPESGGTGVWLLGTHGGSGARCLSAVLTGTRLAGKTWPTPVSDREPVVLVCRGNHRGLSSAQEYARAYRDGRLAEQLQLVGVIVSADAPGRTPPPLRRLERLLSGAAPIIGHAPWEPTWRTGPPQTTAAAEALPWIAKLGQSLATATGAAVTP